ncbi:MAG: tRNA lysidine(34) synthetase TilS [Acidimicrobiia bacterium]
MARPDGGLTLPHVSTAVSGMAGGSARVVALGGGADSAVLLAASVAIDDGAWSRAVFVAHGLAGSTMLEKSATELCLSLGVPLTVLDAPVADGPNLEERARDARYAALTDVLGDDDAGLLGHTKDDQAETVLMRMAHGSGALGISGIPARRDGWHRPLLSFGRADLRQLADSLGLMYVDDPANLESRFERVRVRLDVLPALGDAIPDATSGVARSATLIAVDSAVLDEVAAMIPVRLEGDRVWLSAAAISTAPEPIASRAVLRSFGMLDGFRWTSSDVRAVIACADDGKTAQLSAAITATNTGPLVVIGPTASAETPVRVQTPGSFQWCGQSYGVRTAIPGPVLGGGRKTLLRLDIADELVARGPEPGDRIDIGAGHTPVKELLRVSGVHRSQRPVSLVLTVGGRIAAIAGVRTAAWAVPAHGEQAVIIEREVHQ